ncbi:hypothetical protein D3C74_330170 [compost metagenome]
MPVATNSSRKDPKNSPKLCDSRAWIAPKAPSAMTPNATIVTRAPPTLSAIVPPSGRDTEPTSAPRNAIESVTSGNWFLSSVGNAPE